MFCFNRKLDDAFEFIKTLDFDIMCLQEVPEEFATRLRTLPFFIAESNESTWEEKIKGILGTQHVSLVILSKHKMVSHRAYPVVARISKSHRADFFRWFMKYAAHWRAGELTDRTMLSADIEVLPASGTEAAQLIRIFNVHLQLLTPEIRQAEFQQVREHLQPPPPTIVCGDFNILDSWRIKPLNWLLSGPLTQAFPWYSERKHIEKTFRESGLKNIFRKVVTHRISNSQLDHILVPLDTEVLDRHVVKKTRGSDHRPIITTIKLS
jgi:endonuclease/exonuclease/phosphatase family metal-dependent hydrolase